MFVEFWESSVTVVVEGLVVVEADPQCRVSVTRERGSSCWNMQINEQIWCFFFRWQKGKQDFFCDFFTVFESFYFHFLFFLKASYSELFLEAICSFFFSAADWKLDEPAWSGRMKITAKGKKAFIKLEDRNTGKHRRHLTFDLHEGTGPKMNRNLRLCLNPSLLTSWWTIPRSP